MGFSMVKRWLFWGNDFIHGRKIGVFYDDLKRVNLDYDQGCPIQQQHLSAILEHAVTNSKFYCNMVGKNRGG